MDYQKQLEIIGSLYAEKQEELRDISVYEEKITGITHDTLERRERVMEQLVALDLVKSDLHHQIRLQKRQGVA
jgi:hypothetical protein